MKLLTGWFAKTRLLRTRQGKIVLQYAEGDLRLVINDLDTFTLTSAGGGESVLKHVRALYNVGQCAVLSGEHAEKDESLKTYVARKTTMLNELARAPCDLPSSTQGYILLRDAMMSAQAWDTVETWTKREVQSQ